MREEGVGVVADVEEDFWDVRGFEDVFKSDATWILGGESGVFERVDVNDVDFFF